ncbi:MAG: S8 family serine peptidase, partial [bacterium]|nr:S8 family serine peptidase [bacterium]
MKEPAALQARATSPWKAKASPGLPSAYARSLQAKQEKLIHAIQGKHLQLRVGRRFVSLLNAFVVEGSETALADLAASPEVAFLAPNRLLQPRLTQTGQSMALSLAWDRLGGGGMAGRNVLVGIIDTGIDISNPSFDPTGWIYPPGFPKGEPAYTTPKVIVARAFPRNPNSSTTPWQNYIPWDQAGHGTDVASIVGANYQTVSPLGQVSGIAPGIYLGNYKVFVESGGASTDQMVAALEQAVEDGCDIVNLSLGVDTFYDPRQDPAHIAIQNTIDQGVVVVVAAGNTGVSNTVGGIAGVDDVIAVGSISNSHQKGTPVPTDEVLIEVWVDQERVLYDIVARVGLSDQPFSHPLLGTYPVQDIDFLDGGTYGGTEDGLVCDTLALSQPLAGWTLVQRGICDFTDKANRIAAEGAVGMLLYDNRDSVDIPLLAGNVLPTVMVDRDDGLAIKDLLLRHASTAIQITLSAFPARKAGNTAGYLSGFSSGGPAAEFVVKPDLLAIGEGSYGATQDDFNSSDYDVSGFKWYSGTSMSSPRVAGVAALLKQSHPEWRPSWIKSALQLSAESFVPKNLGSRTNASLLFRGAGRVDANAALQVDTLALPAVLNFGKRVWTAPQTQTVWTTVINTSPISCTYQ